MQENNNKGQYLIRKGRSQKTIERCLLKKKEKRKKGVCKERLKMQPVSLEFYAQCNRFQK